MNTLEVGDLVGDYYKEGVVIYSSPVPNEVRVLFTVWWYGRSDWKLQYKLGHIVRIERPTKELIQFGRERLFFLMTEELKRYEEERLFTKLNYLAAMNILNKYEKTLSSVKK